MNEVEKAYIAGIVDGEGTIGLWRHHKNETASPMVTIIARLVFSMKSKVI